MHSPDPNFLDFPHDTAYLNHNLLVRGRSHEAFIEWSRCGACGVTRTHAPGGLGSPSGATTSTRLQWRTRPDERREILRDTRVVRSNSHGPGDRNRRSGAPIGAASRFEMPTQRSAGLASLSAPRDLTWMRRSALRSLGLFRGRNPETGTGA